MEHFIRQIDADTHLICLEVPTSSIVLLQGLFETYEGLGTVRSLDTKNSLLSVITTGSCLNDCLKLLESIKNEIPWRAAEQVPDNLLDFLKD